jgi:hypothetical protein
LSTSATKSGLNRNKFQQKEHQANTNLHTSMIIDQFQRLRTIQRIVQLSIRFHHKTKPKEEEEEEEDLILDTAEKLEVKVDKQFTKGG